MQVTGYAPTCRHVILQCCTMERAQHTTIPPKRSAGSKPPPTPTPMPRPGILSQVCVVEPESVRAGQHIIMHNKQEQASEKNTMHGIPGILSQVRAIEHESVHRTAHHMLQLSRRDKNTTYGGHLSWPVSVSARRTAHHAPMNLGVQSSEHGVSVNLLHKQLIWANQQSNHHHDSGRLSACLCKLT